MIVFSLKKSYLNIEGRSRDRPACFKLLLACTIDKFLGLFFLQMPKIWHAVLVVLEFCDEFICFIIYERQEYKNETILKLKIINFLDFFLNNTECSCNFFY